MATVYEHPAVSHVGVVVHSVRCGIGPRGAQAIADAPNLRYLRTLSLFGNPIGDEGAGALALSPHLTNLESLCLIHCRVSEPVLRVVFDAPDRPHLKAPRGYATAHSPQPGPRPRPSPKPAPKPHSCVSGLADAIESGTTADRWGRSEPADHASSAPGRARPH